MSYKFDKQKLITCGIERTLPQSVIMLLWELVMSHVEQSQYERKEVDYLQVFELSVNTATQTLTVEHRQEVPKYRQIHRYMLRVEALPSADRLTVFVIDDVTHSTMLLSEEY